MNFKQKLNVDYIKREKDYGGTGSSSNNTNIKNPNALP
jgi:hypothetical protein